MSAPNPCGSEIKVFPALPAPPGYHEPPVWTGRGFRVGAHTLPVLCYERQRSSWTEALTTFHEEIAGGGHYIDRASREHAISRLTRWIRTPCPVILEIGCSSGYFLKLLRERMPEALAIGADYIRGPLERLSQALPGTPLLQFDLRTCPLPDCSLDAVVMLNVLEHIDDDEAALRHVERVLRPGGIAIIEVPAGPHLYDLYDKQLLHFRRYRMAGLISKVEASGLAVMEKSHLGFFLYPGFWMVKKAGRKHLDDDDAAQKKMLSRRIRAAGNNPIMHFAMSLESRLRDMIYLPWGIRCLVACRKN